MDEKCTICGGKALHRKGCPFSYEPYDLDKLCKKCGVYHAKNKKCSEANIPNFMPANWWDEEL